MKRAVVLLLLLSAATISGYAQMSPPFTGLVDAEVAYVDAYMIAGTDYGAAANEAVWSQCYSTYNPATDTYSGKGQCQQATITVTSVGGTGGTTLMNVSVQSGNPGSMSVWSVTNPCLPNGTTVTLSGPPPYTYTLSQTPTCTISSTPPTSGNPVFTLSGTTYWPYPYMVRGSNGIHNTYSAVEIQGPGMLENYHVRPLPNTGTIENGHYGVWGSSYYSTHMTLAQGSTNVTAMNALQVQVTTPGSGMSPATYGPFTVTGCSGSGGKFFLRVRSATVVDPIYVKFFTPITNYQPTTCIPSYTTLTCGTGATCPNLAISIVATIPQGAYIGGKGIIPDTYIFGSPVPSGQTAPTVMATNCGSTNPMSPPILSVSGGSSNLTNGLWWAFADYNPASPSGATYGQQPAAVVLVAGGRAQAPAPNGSALISCGSAGTPTAPVTVTFTLGSTMLSQQAHIDFEAVPSGPTNSTYICGVSRVEGLIASQTTISGPFVPSNTIATVDSTHCATGGGGRGITLQGGITTTGTATTPFPYMVGLASTWDTDVVAQLYEPAILFPFNNNALLNVEGVNARAGCRDCEVIDDGGIGATGITPATQAVARTVTGVGGIGVNTHDNFYLDHPQMNFLLGSLYSFGGQQIWNPFYTPTMPSQISGIRDSHYLNSLSGYYGGNWLTGQTMVSFLSPFEGGSTTADDQNQISVIGGELNFYDGPMLGLSCANPAQMNSGFGIPCVRYIDFIGTHSEGGWNMGHFDAAGAINIQSPGPVVSMANANYVTFLGGALSNPGPGSAIFNDLTSSILHVSGSTLSPSGKTVSFVAGFTHLSTGMTYQSGLSTAAFDTSGRWDGIPLTVAGDSACSVSGLPSDTCIIWLAPSDAVTSPTNASIDLCYNGTTYLNTYCGSSGTNFTTTLGYGGYYAANHSPNSVGWDFSSTNKYQDNSTAGLEVLGLSASGSPVANGFIVGSNGNTGQISGLDGTWTYNSTQPGGSVITANQFSATEIDNNATQTVETCSGGNNATFSQPEQGSSWKRVIVHLNACSGTTTYNFPQAFSYTPFVQIYNSVSCTVTPSTTAVMLNCTGAQTGFIELGGY